MICSKCNEDKGNDFRKSRTVCRECDNALAREKTKQDKEKEKPESIICNVCGNTTSDFRINRKKCLDCERQHGRKYRKETDKAKVWAENNREKMNELQRNWTQKRKIEDPLFKQSSHHKSVVCKMLKKEVIKANM